MKNSDNKTQNQNYTDRSPGIAIVAFFMIAAGCAEMITGFRHNFFGIVTSGEKVLTISSVIIGGFYAIAGMLLLTKKKSAARVALILLCIDFLGRISLVLSHLYPTDSVKNTLSIIAGTVIVIVIAIYIGMKMKTFN